MKKFFSVFNVFRREVIVLLLALKNPKTPKKAKGMMLLAIIYLISPVDILPDTIPLAGIVDDMVIVPAALYWIMKFLPKNVRADSEAKAATAVNRVTLVLVGATFFVVFWLALIVYGIYKLIAA